MSWFERILPKRTTSVSDRRKSVPEGVWAKCKKCDAVLYRAELERTLEVCPKCSFHMRIKARTRLERFLDNGQLEEIPLYQQPPVVWYTKMNWVLLTLWLICLAVMLYTFRQKPVIEAVEVETPQASAADKIFVLLEQENISPRESWQQIERLLITHFFDLSEENHLSVHEKLIFLKESSISGPLIELLEVYLHAPNGKDRVSLNEIKDKITHTLGNEV